MKLGRAGVLLCACAWALSPSHAHAQQGFALNDYDPAVVGSDWFDGDSLDFRGRGRPAVGLIGNYAHQPLIVEDADGNVIATPVENQLWLHLGGAVNLWDRVRLEMMLPLLAWNEGEDATIGGTTYAAPQGSAIGDLRMGADVRLLGRYQGPFSLAAGLRLQLPTGSREAYTSDEATMLGGRLLAAGDLGPFAYAARIGVRGRFNETTVNNVTVGTELVYGASAGFRFAEKKALLGVEWYGTGNLAGGDAFAPRTVPQELLGSFNYRVHDFILGAAAGPGLTGGFGSPTVRGLLRLVWFPEPHKPKPQAEPAHEESPPQDCDGDGVSNSDDACPGEPGAKSDDPKLNGCPPPADQDGDGIIDAEDACPMESGEASDDPKQNGCPPPPPDQDNDGILNEEDACPQAAGRAHDDPKLNGCPVVIVSEKSIDILERVEFEKGSAKIDEHSYQLLDDIAQLLVEHPELELVEVEGHTDNSGPAYINRNLSKQRAESVVKYVVDKGVDKERLIASGRGPDIPIASNETHEGRVTNRRVEFHIRRRKAAEPAGSGEAAASGSGGEAAPAESSDTN